jgi:hypothetical protein
LLFNVASERPKKIGNEWIWMEYIRSQSVLMILIYLVKA